MESAEQRDRRNPELTGFRKRLDLVERDLERVERQSNSHNYALFGIPEVPNTGLVATVERTNQELSRFRNAVASLVVTGIIGIGTAMLIHFT